MIPIDTLTTLINTHGTHSRPKDSPFHAFRSASMDINDSQRMAALARKEAAKDPLSLSSVLANLGSKEDEEDNRPVPGEFKIPQIPKPTQVRSLPENIYI